MSEIRPLFVGLLDYTLDLQSRPRQLQNTHQRHYEEEVNEF